ncbi:UNKNOWN [Stylonychia lemnae]|uniref:Uncharacterized protein n=1 Tax=Stylonychia lemnae TaxID=5949 RepID=A0A078B791_STYLE|nr:UNKNOWN [Stylonychia lemnae]|eukprot:CDW90279.1 UNKNOWN [Stylonychia lemnae]
MKKMMLIKRRKNRQLALIDLKFLIIKPWSYKVNFIKPIILQLLPSYYITINSDQEISLISNIMRNKYKQGLDKELNPQNIVFKLFVQNYQVLVLTSLGVALYSLVQVCQQNEEMLNETEVDVIAYCLKERCEKPRYGQMEREIKGPKFIRSRIQVPLKMVYYHIQFIMVTQIKI